MTDKVLPSFGRTARSREYTAALAYAGGAGDGVVWPSSSRLVEDSEGELATGALGAFDYVSSSGLDVTIDTGEALVRGAYCARDTQTTYTLPESSTTTIYLGWKDGQADTIIIGESSDFGSEDPHLAIWTFDTDSTSVTGSTDERPMADEGYIAAGSIKRGANLIDDGDGYLAVDQGQGSGLNADNLRGRADYYHPDNVGPGSGLDTDTVHGGHIPFGTTATFDNLTQYSASVTNDTVDVFNVSGSGVVVQGVVLSETAGGYNSAEVEIDGTAHSISLVNAEVSGSTDTVAIGSLPTVRFESSARFTVSDDGDGGDFTIAASSWIRFD